MPALISAAALLLALSSPASASPLIGTTTKSAPFISRPSTSSSVGSSTKSAPSILRPSAAPLLASVTESTPLIMNQGPSQRCYHWYSEPANMGFPPDKETLGCVDDKMYGKFTLADYGWRYPQDYAKSPGFSGSVTGAHGTPLTVSLTNNAKGSVCNEVHEVNLSFDYPTASLPANISYIDLGAYDSVIIEYDITIKAATTNKAECSCLHDGVQQCPQWWKTQFTTDILYYQGPDHKEFNAISVRHFDPQENPWGYWEAAGGHRIQYSDHQIPPKAGATAHVKLDAKDLIAKYASQLCQPNGQLTRPINLRSIQLVSINTGTDMTVEIKNVKANAFKYAPGTFTATAHAPGCTPANCPTQPTDPKNACPK